MGAVQSSTFVTDLWTFWLSIGGCDTCSIACRMGELLDELSVLNSKAVDMDISLLDKKIDQMMPELGFSQEDNDRLVASYRSASTASMPTTQKCSCPDQEKSRASMNSWKMSPLLLLAPSFHFHCLYVIWVWRWPTRDGEVLAQRRLADAHVPGQDPAAGPRPAAPG